MKLEDIKVGMKVRLLGKHDAGDNFDNIEDWFEYCEKLEYVQQIKEQGYGVVTDIDEYGSVQVANNIDGEKWWFLISDVEPYEEELTGKSTSIKTPKEWLLTPSVICTTRGGREFMVISNSIIVTLDNYDIWNGSFILSYNENLINVNNCPDSDIVKITYGKETVYERKEQVKEMTIDEIEKIVGSKIKIVNNK